MSTKPEAMTSSELDLINRLRDNISTVMRSSTNSCRLLLSAFFSGGHVLLEDVPGTGETTLAKSLAASIDARFKRVK